MTVPEGEPALLLVLAGGVCLHHWQPALEALPPLARFPLAALALGLPSLLALALGRLVSPEQWRQTLYGLLPLVWGVLLARHLPLAMAEAGQLLPVTLGPAWPGWSADPHVLAFCQSTAVFTGVGASLLLLRRMLLGEGRLLWWGSGLALLLGAGGRWLVVLG